MKYAVIIGVIILILAIMAGVWFWYTNTPGYKAAKATAEATAEAMAATNTSPVGLQQGVNDTLEAAEAQRRQGVDIDPGLAALRIIQTSYLNVNPKWNELRSTTVDDPSRRINIVANLSGMIEANVQLFVRTIPYITSQEGLDYAKSLFLQMATDTNNRRNCWWNRETGCHRQWSVGEPHEDIRVDEEQARMRDIARRILLPLQARARQLGKPLFTPAEVRALGLEVRGDPTRTNMFGDETYALIAKDWLV